mgnify:CR=1 FL=1
MNKAQKAVEQAKLDAEKKVLKKLKEIYEQAAKDCTKKIKLRIGHDFMIETKIHMRHLIISTVSLVNFRQHWFQEYTAGACG